MISEGPRKWSGVIAMDIEFCNVDMQPEGGFMVMKKIFWVCSE
jgi:hypothetical protein